MLCSYSVENMQHNRNTIGIKCQKNGRFPTKSRILEIRDVAQNFSRTCRDPWSYRDLKVKTGRFARTARSFEIQNFVQSFSCACKDP